MVLKLKGEFKQVYENLENPQTKMLVRDIEKNVSALVIIKLVYICYSPDERSVLGKTVPAVLDTTLGLRPTASGGTQDRGHSFSQYEPALAGE